MPAPTKAQLVLLELAGAAGVVGWVEKGIWLPIGGGIGALLLLLAIVPLPSRWLYQGLVSRFALIRRRRRAHGTGAGGLASLVGSFDVVMLPGGGRLAAMAVVHSGRTWALPLELPLEDVFNEDEPIPLDALVSLLAVDDAALASVRLINVVTPGVGGSVAPLRARRLLVLTLDTLAAADALAARGGTEAAVAQILRRSARRAEETFSGVGLRTLDETETAALFEMCLRVGTPGPAGDVASEHWRVVEVEGSRSVTVAVHGPAERAVPGLAVLAAESGVTSAVTAVVLTRATRGAGANVNLLLRLTSAASDGQSGRVPDQLSDAARRLGVSLRPLHGEQAASLRATTPLGVTS